MTTSGHGQNSRNIRYLSQSDNIYSIWKPNSIPAYFLAVLCTTGSMQSRFCFGNAKERWNQTQLFLVTWWLWISVDRTHLNRFCFGAKRMETQVFGDGATFAGEKYLAKQTMFCYPYNRLEIWNPDCLNLWFCNGGLQRDNLELLQEEIFFVIYRQECGYS